MHGTLRQDLDQRKDCVRERGIGHCHIDVTATPAAARVQQRNQHADHGRHRSPQQIADLQIGDRRCAPGHANLVEHAGVADIVDIVARPERIGPGLPVTGDAAEHQARIDCGQLRIAESELVHDPGPKALDHGIGRLHQAQEHGPAGLLFEIEAQALLVAIDHLIEIAAVAGHCTHRAGVIARTGILDLDDLGTVIRQMLGCQRAGQKPGEVEDAQAGQRLSLHGGSRLKRKREGPGQEPGRQKNRPGIAGPKLPTHNTGCSTSRTCEYRR